MPTLDSVPTFIGWVSIAFLAARAGRYAWRRWVGRERISRSTLVFTVRCVVIAVAAIFGAGFIFIQQVHSLEWKLVLASVLLLVGAAEIGVEITEFRATRGGTAVRHAQAVLTAYRDIRNQGRKLGEELGVIMRASGVVPEELHARVDAWSNRCILWLSDAGLTAQQRAQASFAHGPSANAHVATYFGTVQRNLLALESAGKHLGIEEANGA